MARVMTKCPITGKPISTGMAFDEGSFRSSTLTDNSVRCSECGQSHTWNKEDAYLEDEGS